MTSIGESVAEASSAPGCGEDIRGSSSGKKLKIGSPETISSHSSFNFQSFDSLWKTIEK